MPKIQDWTTVLNSGIAIPGITENIHQNLTLYPAAWRVRYYNYQGTKLLHTEYVEDGEDAVWGAGRGWSDVAEGSEVSGILSDISDNLDVYSSVASTSLLLSSDPTKILAEGLCESYFSGDTDLGGIVIVGTPTVQIDGALRMPGSTSYAYYSENEGQAMTLYGVLSGYGSDIEWGRAMSLAYSSSTSNEILFAYRSGNTVWYSLYNITNNSLGKASNVKHVFAFSVDSSKSCKSYIDGVYYTTESLSNVGFARWTYGANENYQNADFYYGAVVDGQETDEVIISNMQNIMNHYGIT